MTPKKLETSLFPTKRLYGLPCDPSGTQVQIFICKVFFFVMPMAKTYLITFARQLVDLFFGKTVTNVYFRTQPRRSEFPFSMFARCTAASQTASKRCGWPTGAPLATDNKWRNVARRCVCYSCAALGDR